MHHEAAKPVGIQRLRTKGFNLQAASLALNGLPALSVCRPGIWGNPFVCSDPQKAVDAYERLVQGGTQVFSMGPGKLEFARNAHRDTLHWAFAEWFAKNVARLRGHNLACFCALDQPCHRNIILKFANPGG